MTRYIIFNSVFAFIGVYLWQFYDIFRVIADMDPTRVTFLILGIYASATIYLGLFKWDANFQAVKFVSSKLTGIGLVGTVIGIMLLLSEAAHLQAGNVIGTMFHGMGTVLITTLFGILFNLVLSFQVGWCFQEYDE